MSVSDALNLPLAYVSRLTVNTPDQKPKSGQAFGSICTDNGSGRLHRLGLGRDIDMPKTTAHRYLPYVLETACFLN